MSEKFLCKDANVSPVGSAQQWANELILRESRGPGDMENAMRRLEGRYGIPWRTFWKLRYRPPSDIFVSVYERLRAAHETERLRQVRLLQNEIAITEAKTGNHSSAVRKAKALAS